MMATTTAKQRAQRAQEEARQALIDAAELAEDVAYRELLRDDTYNGDQLTDGLATIYAHMGMEETNAADVHVSKLDARGDGIEMGIWKGAPEDYDLEALAKKYGSGQFRVKLYVKMPGGPKVIRGNRIFPWLLAPEEEARRTARPEPVTAPPLTAADVARIVTESLRALPPAAPPVNPMAMLKDLADVFKTMMPAAAPAANLGQMKDVLELVTMLREADPVDRGGDTSTAGMLMRLAEKFAPAIGSIVQQQAALNQAPQLQAPQQPAAVAPAPSAEDEMLRAQQLQMKVGINYLIGAAVADGDPVTYADVILDYVPEPSIRQILAVPSGPVTALAQIDARVNDHRAWFDKVFVEVQKLLDAPEDKEGGAA